MECDFLKQYARLLCPVKGISTSEKKAEGGEVTVTVFKAAPCASSPSSRTLIDGVDFRLIFGEPVDIPAAISVWKPTIVKREVLICKI
jgi:hypothetical protein